MEVDFCIFFYREFIYGFSLEIQLPEGEDWNITNHLTPPHVCVWPKPGLWFPTSYVVFAFVFSEFS